MSRFLRITLRIVIGIALFWGILTFFVQGEGPAFSSDFGELDAEKNALILYDPDPFYDLDAQVCLGMSETISAEGWRVQVKSVKAARQASLTDYDLYIFCANTYNWAPDRALVQLIKDWPALAGENAMAITLGSGSTARSQRLLEETLQAREVNLMDSHSLWLMRPNDEERMEERNVDVAVSMAQDWAKELIASADITAE